MSHKSHGATTVAEWATCRDREMRIQNFNMRPFFNVQILPQGRGGLALKCHNSICLSAKCCLHESGQTKHKGWYRADTNMTITILHLKLHNWRRDNKKEEVRSKNDKWSKSKCHDSRNLYKPSAGSCLHEFGHTNHKEKNWTDTHMTDSSSLKASEPSFSTPPFPLAQGQCFAYCCRVSWKFVPCPCVRNFMAQRRLRNESLAVTLLFSRAEIILFSTESSSFNEVRQLLSEGPKLKAWQRLSNDDAFPNNPRLELQNWNLFTNGPKRAYNLMPSFMKGLRSRPCPCRPSQVSSGRQSFGQKRVWLLFLTWSYTT